MQLFGFYDTINHYFIDHNIDCNAKKDTDINGDNTHFAMADDSLPECASICRNHSKCKAMVYASNKCMLKLGSVGEGQISRPNEGFYSAFKKDCFY